MATISLTTSEWVWYKDGVSGVSKVVGYESSARRVGRFKFTAPSTGASGVTLTLYTDGFGNGTKKIPIWFYIGTSATSHANAGYDSEKTGVLTLNSSGDTFSATASILLVPNQTYYLWIFPGEDTWGWYWGYHDGYTSTLTTSGAAMSEITGTNGTLGSANKLTLIRYSSALTHTISATCGTASMTIATGVQADTVEWTPPIAWAAQNTTGTSVSAKITCTTYNGSTAVGSKSVTLTFAIPASLVPTVEVVVSDKLGYLSKYGSYIQGKSQAQVIAEGTGAQGSTISGYSVECGAVTKSGASTVFDLLTAGTITIKVTVTDSRGRKGTTSVNIEVAAYSPPKATITAAYRCDADGNEDPDGAYAVVVFDASVTTLGEKNSASYALKYRVRGTTAWSSVTISALSGNYAPSKASQVIPVSTEKGYDVSIEVTDDFGPVLSTYRTIQIVFRLMDISLDDKAISFGQRATVPNAVAFGLKARFNAGISMLPIVLDSMDQVDDALSGIVAGLDRFTATFSVFSIGSATWFVFVYKSSVNCAFAELKTYLTSGYHYRKVMNDGTWGELLEVH